ncbi:MAG: hypothetical protein K9L86_05735 [Candidatus Omnitrophica bacterium]|nr:hypothetical protein [Candidatus Omnitrophota bacterium]
MDKKKTDWTKPSLIMLGIDVLALFIMMIVLGNLVNRFNELYSQFSIELSPIAQFSLTGYKIFFLLLLIGLLGKEFLKNKKATFIINISALAVTLFIFVPFIILGIFFPLFNLTSMGG